MSKIYQPIVIKECERFMNVLTENGFFVENDIEDLTFARTHLCDKITEKFINGELGNDEPYFTDVEFGQIMREMVVGSILYQLKEKGYINSYEDENTEEIFFLTEEGKKYMEELKKSLD